MLKTRALGLIAALVMTSLPLFAQKSQVMKFAAPKRLKAGDAFVGADRSYPSPTVHDVNGDGMLDVVVGDLRGAITIAHGQRGDNGATLGSEVTWKGLDGKPLEFDNW